MRENNFKLKTVRAGISLRRKKGTFRQWESWTTALRQERTLLKEVTDGDGDQNEVNQKKWSPQRLSIRSESGQCLRSQPTDFDLNPKEIESQPQLV